MGGVFGHMSHIYDNPNMTFGQIKDIMTKASAGQLENVTEKDFLTIFPDNEDGSKIAFKEYKNMIS